jgi:hypothetical protein
MQLLGSRVQNIQVPECSPEGRRNVGGKAAREQTLAWVSTDIYMLLYVGSLTLFDSLGLAPSPLVGLVTYALDIAVDYLRSR